MKSSAGGPGAVIEAQGLTKRYGSKLAVDDLWFTVRPGRVTGFLGPNGAGKSSTMRLLLGLDRPDSGTATRRVDQVITLTGLSAAAGKRARGLSLGMAQRLGIAAAMLGDPEVLLLDEPVNGLDPEGGVLAVPRRIPMLAAKAAVVGALAFAVGEVVAFASLLIAQPIIGRHLPESLRDASTLRAVAGVGLYLAVLALFGFAVGAIIRHTGGAITAVVGLVLVAGTLGGLLPGSVGQHISAYLPANAGLLITHSHQEATVLLSPWQGLGVFCLWTAALLALAGFLLARRDA